MVHDHCTRSLHVNIRRSLAKWSNHFTRGEESVPRHIGMIFKHLAMSHSGIIASTVCEHLASWQRFASRFQLYSYERRLFRASLHFVRLVVSPSQRYHDSSQEGVSTRTCCYALSGDSRALPSSSTARSTRTPFSDGGCVILVG